MNDEQPISTAKPKRKSSEKRLRDEFIGTRWTKDERATLEERADASGHTVGAFIRAAALGDAGPRARRRLPVNDQALVKALALHGRYGNNMNQIAHQLNAQGEDALAADFRRALKEWAEIRDAMYEALGREPSGGTPSGHTPA